MSLVRFDNVDVRAGGLPVLHGIDLEIEPGEIVTVVGPNGAGKSTLVRALIGAAVIDAGTITRAPDLRIGYVPQSLALDPGLPMTVRRFMALPSRAPATEIAEALDAFGATGLDDKQMSAVSGGQLQRVLLARALLSRPNLLILDEPTKGLDPPGEAALYRRIEAVRNEAGAAILLVSHDLHVVMQASDRVVCLNGHICCIGAPSVISDAPEYRALFGRGTEGAFALYPHAHDHGHDHAHD